MRLEELDKYKNFEFIHSRINTEEARYRIIDFSPDVIIHLAAQAGVRFTPNLYYKYFEDNIQDFFSITEIAKFTHPKLFLYASSSSVYGNSKSFPLNENTSFLNPTSFYGATKLSNEFHAREAFAQTHIKNLGLRFFTVYGPSGRPDMAIFRLFYSALRNKTFQLFGDGNISRDFTFIEDVVEIISKIIDKSLLKSDPIPNVLNIGGGKSYSISELVKMIEVLTNNEIKIEYQDANPSDIKRTEASFEKLFSFIGRKPIIELETGLQKTLDWFEVFLRSNYSSENIFMSIYEK